MFTIDTSTRNQGVHTHVCSRALIAPRVFRTATGVCIAEDLPPTPSQTPRPNTTGARQADFPQPPRANRNATRPGMDVLAIQIWL
mmetsp:Transcript_7033/g.11187  ORF Transcript_7033/g.11187 Transcript_7033/m.11187 type:complete len:85 (-) Transcript_7033:243-497(-)